MQRSLLSSALVVAAGLCLTTASSATGPGSATNGATANTFVNDPCLDPPAPLIERTVQSETDIAVLNDSDGDAGGRLMVAGYNDSSGLYDPFQGLSGFSYSTTGGDQWIDGGGLPPALGTDVYLGQPSVAVHHGSRTFYYASLYQREPFPALGFTISVNRGQFKVAPRQVPVESFANTRCEGRPELYGLADPPDEVRERIIWDPPVAAVTPSGDGFERPWLYVNQETGVLYLTYTRFDAIDGSTPVELVRSYDGGLTWTPPSVVVESLTTTFNQGPRAVVTPTGRVVVSWQASRFLGAPQEQRIEAANSDNCRLAADACTFTAPIVVARVNPQGPPPGDNSGDFTFDNVPSIAVDKGRDDGVITAAERLQPGFGNVYITYFNGKTPFTKPECDPSDPEKPSCVPYLPAGDILLSRSIDDGTAYLPPVTVNDDDDEDDDDSTSHVFPSVQVNQYGDVFVTWLDRREDDRNLLTDTWADVSTTRGATFGSDGRISTVSTDWIVRNDYSPNFGSYISSDVIGFTHFLSIWADGRFPEPKPISGSRPYTRNLADAATPDVLTGIVRRTAPPPPRVFGCTDPNATNYNPNATADDGTCVYPPPPPVRGCTDPKATNFNPNATVDDGSCTYPPPPPPPPVFPSDGLFVIGDGANHAVGARVNFWGAHWPKNNPTTKDGSSPGAFKGFAVGNATPSCGGTWTDRPGNSSKPPKNLPELMAVVVTSDITKKGSSISGTIRRIVVVRVEPGYGPAPGHAGYGTVVAELCAAAPATLSVWWPTEQAEITGLHAFKARLEGRSLTSYEMFWQVDGDRENAMYDSRADGGRKEAMVDVSRWNWRGRGPYAVTFVARDASRNVIAQRTVSIRIAR